MVSTVAFYAHDPGSIPSADIVLVVYVCPTPVRVRLKDISSTDSKAKAREMHFVLVANSRSGL